MQLFVIAVDQSDIAEGFKKRRQYGFADAKDMMDWRNLIAKTLATSQRPKSDQASAKNLES